MTQLRPKQVEGVLEIERYKGRMLIADEMGVGKTIQALTYMSRNREACVPTIVVCPASLKYNWYNESLLHLGHEPLVLFGRKPSNLEELKAAKLIILNYEILGGWLKEILELNPKLIIIDEAHYIKNKTTNAYKAVSVLCHKRDKILLLTGTPIANRPIDMWTLLNTLWRDQFPDYKEFGFRYCGGPVRTQRGKHIVITYPGSSNMPELHKRLNKLGMLRRRLIDVAPELRPTIINTVKIDLPAIDMMKYCYIRDNWAEYCRKEFSPDKAVKMISAERLQKTGTLMRKVSSFKLEFTLDWLENFLQNTDGKIIVAGWHKKTLKNIAENFPENAVIYNGDTTYKARREYEQAFNRDPKCRILCGNIGTIATGLNFQVASTGLFVEYTYLPSLHAQTMARNNRIGTKGLVTWHWLTASNTIEQYICSMLIIKQKASNVCIDGMDESDTRGDIFQEVYKQLYAVT